MCSFILSQNNHIPRIKGIIERLCQRLGRKSPARLGTLSPRRSAWPPAPWRIWRLCGRGSGPSTCWTPPGRLPLARWIWPGWPPHPWRRGRRELQTIFGVGPKVAECALLYGFHKTECFPLDVWMKRAMATLLPGRRPEEFGENAGLAQQYLFHYSRMHPELFAEKTAYPPANRR